MRTKKLVSAVVCLRWIVLAGACPLLADDLTLGWRTVDGGGLMFSTGGGLEMSGTIGQPDAQAPPVMSGGGFELAGGFWPGVTPPCNGFHPCDTNCDGSINGGDIGWFIDLLNGVGTRCSPCAGDTNADGSINGGDINNFIECLNAP